MDLKIPEVESLTPGLTAFFKKRSNIDLTQHLLANVSSGANVPVNYDPGIPRTPQIVSLTKLGQFIYMDNDGSASDLFTACGQGAIAQLAIGVPYITLCPSFFELPAEVPQSQCNCSPLSRANPGTYLDAGSSPDLSQSEILLNRLVATYMYAPQGTYASWRDLGFNSIRTCMGLSYNESVNLSANESVKTCIRMSITSLVSYVLPHVSTVREIEGCSSKTPAHLAAILTPVRTS